MCGACEQCKQPCDEGCKECYAAGVFLEEAFGYLNHIVQTACGLQGGGGCDDADDDEHDVNGDAARLQSKHEHQNKDTDHAVDAQSYAANLGSDEYHGQDDKQL